MTWLKRLGIAIVKGAAIWAGIVPVVKRELPGTAGPVDVISRELAEIANVIIAIEAMGTALGLKGEAKLHAAAPLVAQVILQSAVIADRPIADPQVFHQGATAVADGFAKILNSLRADDSDVAA